MTENTTRPFFYVLIRGRNCFENFDRCIDSVLSQDYNNYEILFIDDASKLSINQRKHIQNRLSGHVVIFNKIRKYSLYNQYYMIHKYATNDDSIVVNLDSDDWFSSVNSLSTIANEYTKNQECQFTYGECFIWDGNSISKQTSRYILKSVNVDYPEHVKKSKLFRLHPFLPLHPRTFKVSLFKKIKKSEFVDENGRWYRFAEDQATFFSFFESSNNYRVIKTPIYVYNMENPLADVKQNLISLLRDELAIRRRIYGRIKKTVTVFKKKQLTVSYLGLLNNKVLGFLIYKLQMMGYLSGFVNNIFLSEKVSGSQQLLIRYISSHEDTLIIKSHMFGNLLSEFKSNIVLDCNNVDIKQLSQNESYSLMWSLVFSKYVTQSCVRKLKSLLPNNYPVCKIEIN